MIQSILINRQVDELGETIQKKFLEFFEKYSLIFFNHKLFKLISVSKYQQGVKNTS